MIPMYLAGGPLIGYWMGTWLNNKFGTGPYVRAGLMVLGLIAAGREAWRIIREISSSDKQA